jgi:hypothetical protein
LRLGHDECDLLARSERYPHYVSDAQLEIAGIVAQREIEASRADRCKRVDGAD